MQILKLKSKYDARQSLQDTHRSESQRFINEVLNSEGISNQAKLLLTIINLKFNDRDLHENIFIKILYKDEFKKTAILSNRGCINWNENVEFPVESQRDKIRLEICQIIANKEIVTGNINIPLDAVENQDEYECEIEIPEGKNVKNTGKKSEIKLKMQFIRSFHMFHIESALKVEIENKEIMNNIMTIQKTFELLNGI